MSEKINKQNLEIFPQPLALTPEQAEKLRNCTRYENNPSFPTGLFAGLNDSRKMEILVHCIIELLSLGSKGNDKVDLTKPFTMKYYQEQFSRAGLETAFPRLLSEGYLLFENDEYHLTDKLLKAVISRIGQIQSKTEEQNFIDFAGEVYPEITCSALHYLAGCYGYKLIRAINGSYICHVTVRAIDTYKTIGSGKSAADEETAFKNAIENLLAVKNGVRARIVTGRNSNLRRTLI